MNNFLSEVRKIKNPDREKIAVLIRHGERENIPEGTFGNEILLTERGKHDSTELGKQLAAYRINKIFTSPVKRCVQTAEMIKKGSRQDVKIILSNQLGNPGFHISNGHTAGKAFLDHGCFGVFERFLHNENIEGVADANSLRTDAVNWLYKETKENGLTLFITHDSLIAHFAFANNIREYSPDNWVDFLDGIILNFSEGTKK